MANALVVIEPYWYQHKYTWVFDDLSKGLEKEPLDGIHGEGEEFDRWVFQTSSMIDFLVKDVPSARNGFILLCSSQPLTGYQLELTREREDGDGYLYQIKDSWMGWWLSPALLSYFEAAPESIYLKAEPHRNKHEIIEEVVALRDRVEQLEQMVGKLTLENDLLQRGNN